MFGEKQSIGVQWLSGIVEDLRLEVPGSSLIGGTVLGPWARHFILIINLTLKGSACTSGPFGRFYVGNWLPYAENSKVGCTMTSP